MRKADLTLEGENAFLDHEAIFLKSQGQAILHFAGLVLLVIAVAALLVAFGYAMAAWGSKYSGPDAVVHKALLQAKSDRAALGLHIQGGCGK